jgi:predicted DsbA family dithiol-disulfide isomerase
MNIDIISDTVCPWCFIGKRRLERALAIMPQPEPRIGWRPFQLNPDMPVEGVDRGDYMRQKFGEERQAQIHAMLTETGAAEGIDFNFSGIARMPNTLASHRVLRFAGEQGIQHQVAEALFQAFFVEARDIGDRATLLDIGSEAGLERGTLGDYLESEQGLDAVRAEDRLARRMRISGVPTFIFERKYVVSGAQSPDMFLQIFEQLAQEKSSGETAETAEAEGTSQT